MQTETITQAVELWDPTTQTAYRYSPAGEYFRVESENVITAHVCVNYVSFAISMLNIQALIKRGGYFTGR